MLCSQQVEDIFVYNTFINKPNSSGKFIELGALDGVRYSNTYFFESYLGFSGVLIEPNSYFCWLKTNRPKSDCYNVAISTSNEEVILLGDDAMSETFLQNENIDEKRIIERTARKIKTMKMSDIIAQSKLEYIDLFSIDVEGHELEVLQTMNWNIPVYVIVIEMTGCYKVKEDECRKILIKNGFIFKKKISLNEFWFNPDYFRIPELYDSQLPKIRLTKEELKRLKFIEKAFSDNYWDELYL
jgi:FkbM family methyltransferase